jgi:hypothetical protein
MGFDAELSKNYILKQMLNKNNAPYRITQPIFTLCTPCGAGEGNRTLVVSLEGFCSTIELHPPDIPPCETTDSRKPSSFSITI